MAPSSVPMEVGGICSWEYEVRVSRTRLKKTSSRSEMEAVIVSASPPWKKKSLWFRRAAVVSGD